MARKTIAVSAIAADCGHEILQPGLLSTPPNENLPTALQKLSHFRIAFHATKMQPRTRLLFCMALKRGRTAQMQVAREIYQEQTVHKQEQERSGISSDTGTMSPAFRAPPSLSSTG